MAKEEFEIKLSEKETYQLTSRLTNFYEKLDTIQDYFLERKKEKVIDIDHEKYSQHFFNDFTMEPDYYIITVGITNW